MSLLEGASRVALALHYARCGTPLGVINELSCLTLAVGGEAASEKKKLEGGSALFLWKSRKERSGAVVSVLGS